LEIIGEKINGTRERVAKAIEERDSDYIQYLARSQADAGAAWLDVNAGTHPEQEADDLLWLIDTIQGAVDTPLCLDSANPRALQVAIEAVDKTPIINSISGEPERLEGILPLVAEHQCRVIGLAMDKEGIPRSSDGRLAVVDKVVEASRAAGVGDEQLYVDPLVMSISTDTEAANVFLETARKISNAYPAVHLTAGLSNISFGLPFRSLINRVFIALAMAAGLDSAIVDPLDEELMATVLAAELVLGKDPHCLGYTRAYRAGRLGQDNGKE
jgi:cobalamin-dependent methionine synthase I